MKDLEGKHVLITGAGSGIGKAAAMLFAGYGSDVVVSDIVQDSADLTAQAIREQGGNAVAIRADVSVYEDVAGLIGESIDWLGSLDIMVNNAGIGPRKMLRTSRHGLDDWDRVIAVNQTGVFYCMKLALARMEEQGYGSIVNVASLAGLKASGNNLCYAASKFAVVGMTKSAALEYASRNIRINAVCPGYTRSALLDQLLSARDGMEQILLSHMPMGRFGRPEEIAEAIAWLASGSASFITGHTLVLDGGTSL